MKTITITDSEYAEIANRDESHFFDVKQQDVSRKSIQKIGVAPRYSFVEGETELFEVVR